MRNERTNRADVEFPASQFSSAESHRDSRDRIPPIKRQDRTTRVGAINDRGIAASIAPAFNIRSDVSVPRYARGIIYPLVLARGRRDRKSLLISERFAAVDRPIETDARGVFYFPFIFLASPHHLFTRSFICVPRS